MSTLTLLPAPGRDGEGTHIKSVIHTKNDGQKKKRTGIIFTSNATTDFSNWQDFRNVHVSYRFTLMLKGCLLMFNFFWKSCTVYALLVFELPKFREIVCNFNDLESSLRGAKMLFQTLHSNIDKSCFIIFLHHHKFYITQIFTLNFDYLQAQWVAAAPPGVTLQVQSLAGHTIWQYCIFTEFSM